MRLFRKNSGDGSSSKVANKEKAKKNTRQNSAGSSNNNSNGGVASADGKMTVFRVTVPEGTLPGQEFQVYAGNRIVRVRCPNGSSPGQSLQITVPVDPVSSSRDVNQQQLSLNQQQQQSPPHQQQQQQPDIPDSPNTERQEDGAYMVTVPSGVQSGQQFPVTLAGQTLMVTSPPNARPGTSVRILPPPSSSSSPSSAPAAAQNQQQSPFQNNNSQQTTSPQQQLQSRHRSTLSASSDDESEPTQLFEVQVPQGVQPGRPFALLAGGVRVLVTCPVNARAGQRIRFKLPLALTQKREPTSEAAAIKLSYDKDGWTRTIRVSDMKFQWVRVDDKGDVDNTTGFFNAEKSAYVRKLDFRPGTDERVRDADLTLVPATEAFVDSRVRGNNGEILVTYSEIADAQVKSFEDKTKWFQDKCLGLCVDWNEGHMRMNVRREFLLEDSVDAVMSLSRRDLRKLWRFEFIGEMGIDAGGLAREWFQLVTAEIFDPDMGLWQSSEANQMMMVINPASSTYTGQYFSSVSM